MADPVPSPEPSPAPSPEPSPAPSPVTTAAPSTRHAHFAVHAVPADGAEDVVVGTSGRDEGAVFTGTADGSIWRLAHDGSRIDLVARTQGRPLGLELDPDGRLLVCDARRGVLRVDTTSGSVEQVTHVADGRRLVFCNNAAIGDDGTVWFSDSSQHHGIEEWKQEMVRDTRTGRLIRLDPDGTTTTAVSGLGFANGVALAGDGSFVAVAETARRTVVRHWLDGRPAEHVTDHLVTDLPGYPDNIARGSDGLIWVSLASPRDPVVERLQTAPGLLQRLATRVPERLQPRPRRTVRVQAYDLSGALVHDIDISTPHFHMVTGVREHEGRVWLGSLEESAVATFTL